MTTATSTLTADSSPQPADPLDPLRKALFHEMGADGVYARTALYEEMIERLAALITRHREPGTEVMRFPPVFARADYEKIDHIHNFPDLMGSVHTFTGNEREHRDMLGKFEKKDDWSRDLAASQVMMTPAICYPLYPTSSGSTLPAEGRRVDLQGYAFRR